jgi:hypothetical protein
LVGIDTQAGSQQPAGQDFVAREVGEFIAAQRATPSDVVSQPALTPQLIQNPIRHLGV